MSWVPCVLAGSVVLMQAAFGAAEMFAPRTVLDKVFPRYYDSRQSPVWEDAAVIARNMGLYNWFLAIGLALTLAGGLGGLGGPAATFFLVCVCLAGGFAVFAVRPYWLFYAQFGLPLAALLARTYSS